MDQTIKALKEEIEIFKLATKLTEQLFVARANEQSPLCKAFQDGGCANCPVARYTGQAYCKGTPTQEFCEKVDAIVNAMNKGMRTKQLIHEAKYKAGGQYHFLQDVLRSYEKGDNQPNEVLKIGYRKINESVVYITGIEAACVSNVVSDEVLKTWKMGPHFQVSRGYDDDGLIKGSKSVTLYMDSRDDSLGDMVVTYNGNLSLELKVGQLIPAAKFEKICEEIKIVGEALAAVKKLAEDTEEKHISITV